MKGKGFQVGVGVGVGVGKEGEERLLGYHREDDGTCACAALDPDPL